MMTRDLIAAATVLADSLAAENAALAALDLPRVVGMLADKQRAAAGFIDAQAVPIPPTQRAAAATMVRRLQALADENRALLERAIAVQGRVIGVIARAAAPAPAPEGYAAAHMRGHRPVAFALCARA
jgi:hypothetical protein